MFVVCWRRAAQPLIKKGAPEIQTKGILKKAVIHRMNKDKSDPASMPKYSGNANSIVLPNTNPATAICLNCLRAKADFCGRSGVELD